YAGAHRALPVCDVAPRPAPPPPLLHPANTGAPPISGTPIAGQTLAVSPGSWANSPTSFAYQWQRCDSAGKNCANIARATGFAYTLTPAEVGHRLRAIVTASNASGSGSATSA